MTEGRDAVIVLVACPTSITCAVNHASVSSLVASGEPLPRRRPVEFHEYLRAG